MIQAKVTRTLRSLRDFLAGLVLTAATAAGRLSSLPEPDLADECFPLEEEPKSFI